MIERSHFHHARVVDEYVDASVPGKRVVYELLGLVALTHVAGHDVDHTLAGRKVLLCPVELGLVAGGNRHDGAFIGKLPCDQQPEAARAAGDDDHLPVEIHLSAAAQSARQECTPHGQCTGGEGSLLVSCHASSRSNAHSRRERLGALPGRHPIPCDADVAVERTPCPMTQPPAQFVRGAIRP